MFLARTLLAGEAPLFDDVREAAVRNLAIQYESDMPHSEHVAHLSLQMFDSLVDAAACSSRTTGSASCCGPHRCSTTSA